MGVCITWHKDWLPVRLAVLRDRDTYMTNMSDHI